MTTRVESLEALLDAYDRVLEELPDAEDGDDGSALEVRNHFAAKRAEVLTELQGERGAAGLNPLTGEDE